MLVSSIYLFHSKKKLKEVCRNYTAGMGSSINVGTVSIVPACSQWDKQVASMGLNPELKRQPVSTHISGRFKKSEEADAIESLAKQANNLESDRLTDKIISWIHSQTNCNENINILQNGCAGVIIVRSREYAWFSIYYLLAPCYALSLTL